MRIILESWAYKNISRRQFEVFMLVLSGYVVVELYVSTIVDYTASMKTVIDVADFFICMIFLGDFFFGLYYAENKLSFIKKNWIDFVSSIPMVGALRAGRIVKIFRILRVVRSARFIFLFFNSKNSFSTLRNLMLFNGVVILLFTLSFYELEHKLNPHIHTLSDSLWWTTYTTITVGFLQDIPPVTVEGKLLSVVLILLGMIMFSTMIGTITDFFIEDEDIQAKLEDVAEQVNDLETKLDKVLEKLDSLEQNRGNQS